MSTRYQGKSSQPRYLCDVNRASYGGNRCQAVAARPVELAQDLPALWKAEETTDEDRKLILREVSEKVVVNVEGSTEWVEIQVHWTSGKQSYSRIRRDVADATQLSHCPELMNRLQELKARNHTSQQIADLLHEEGFRPPKSGRITAQIVRIWLSRHGLTKQRAAPQQAAENEWTIPAIIKRYQIPSSTVHGWIRRKQVEARQPAGAGGRWFIHATSAELDKLVKARKNRSRRADQKQQTQPAGENTCFKMGAASASAR